VRQTCVVADWSPLRALLADVKTSVTLAWDELDGMVGGLPRSAYVHNAFWKGDRSGWPGFRTTAVKVGESVTFARGSAKPVGERRAAPTPLARSTNPVPDLVLVGCVKKKLDVPAPARELYTSPLFRKERSYAEQAGVPWFVLSAEHGLVAPDEVLAPYDLQLSRTSRDYRRAWGVRVVERLGEVVGPVSGKTIEVHAGSAYTDSIRDLLIREGATVVEPLAGLRMGDRLAWYGRPTAEAPVAEVQSVTPDPNVTKLLAMLTSVNEAITPEEFLAGGDGLRSPGLYSWWVDAQGAADLSRGLNQPVRTGLIYAGLAGATRSRSGRKSKNTLWGRIKTMHLGGRHEFSTFRLSLGSVLAEALGEDEINEEALTAWMHEHLRLVAVPVTDADTLGDVETDVLAELNPPLNLDKVKRDALRAQLSALRKKHGRRGRSSEAPAD
jgi:hypothetical protein